MGIEWNGGDLVSYDDYRIIQLLYRLSLRVERLENPRRAPIPTIIGSCMACGSDYVISNEMAIELNRFNIPKPKRKKRLWSWWLV